MLASFPHLCHAVAPSIYYFSVSVDLQKENTIPKNIKTYWAILFWLMYKLTSTWSDGEYGSLPATNYQIESCVDRKAAGMGPKHGKVILQHDNAPSHTAKVVKNTLKALIWEILSHPPYSPDLASSDYHLFASMGHSLAEQCFANLEEVGKWLVEWFALKEKSFFGMVSMICLKDGQNV